MNECLEPFGPIGTKYDPTICGSSAHEGLGHGIDVVRRQHSDVVPTIHAIIYDEGSLTSISESDPPEDLNHGVIFGYSVGNGVPSTI